MLLNSSSNLNKTECTMTQHIFNKYMFSFHKKNQFILSLSSDVGEGGGKYVTQWLQDMHSSKRY